MKTTGRLLAVAVTAVVLCGSFSGCQFIPGMGGGASAYAPTEVMNSMYQGDVADVFVPGHSPIPEEPEQARAALERMRQILVDARDAIQSEIAARSY